MEKYDQQLQQLRDKYKTAPASLLPIIQRQARAIQIAKEIQRRKQKYE